jgi:hypothetical protein
MRGFSKNTMRNSNKDIMVVFNSDTSATVSSVVEVTSDTVESQYNILPLSDSKEYVDSINGGMVYVFNAQIPALVEAEKLKSMRRSVALKRVFDFDRSTDSIDLFKWIPYVIIIIMIIIRH